MVREPEPVEAGRVLIFPDFGLVHRRDSRRRWLLEIAGFWTPDYLERKLAVYRAADLRNIILCIDEDRRAGDDVLPPAARIVRFRRRIDVQEVLRIVSST